MNSLQERKMSDDHPSSASTTIERHEKSWLDKVLHAFSTEPKSRDELLAIIKDAADNQLLDPEAISIIEGAMDVSSLHTREIMVPRSQIVAIRMDSTPQ
jgi:magnesium and cobalt transporter